MFKFMKRMIYGKDLRDALSVTKTIRVNGVRFIIKKISVLDHASGAKVLIQYHDTYTTKGANQAVDTNLEKKAKEHYKDVLMAGVLSPRLSYKDDGVGVFVDSMFVDFDLVQTLYNEIMILSYGKKKVKFSSQDQS